jgi:hypothetical protein
MEGLETYFGNVVSQHADRHLDLVGIGRLFALSRQPALNALACLRYRAEFGTDSVFALQTSQEKARPGERALASKSPCARLFGDNVTYAKLASLMSQGAEIHTTRLTEQFDFGAYRERYGREIVPLFAIDRKGFLRVFTASNNLRPAPDWKVTSLFPAQTGAERTDSQQPPMANTT